MWFEQSIELRLLSNVTRSADGCAFFLAQAAIQRRTGGLLAKIATWWFALPGLAVVSLLPGCSTMGTVTAGPVFSYSSVSGVGYGWSASGGYATMGSGTSSPDGLGLAFGLGQTWLRQAENVASPATPASRSDGRSFELLTYFDFGLRGSFVDSLPSYHQVGLSFGPAWSSRSEDSRAGLVMDFAPAVAFVPGQYTWFNCGTTSVSAPTFLAIVGFRWLYGSMEIYASPQVGFVSESISGELFCH
jgi:hypothetical protein